MASSSRSHQTLKTNNSTMEHNFVEQEKKVSKAGQEEEEQEQEWLKLGLGLGRISENTPCNKSIGGHGSNPVLHSQGLIIKHHQIGLGLRLGFDPKETNNEGLGSMVEPSSVAYHHHSSSSHHCNDDDDDDGNGMKLWPPCQIGPQGLPVDQSHHSGLWFTLRSSTNRSGEALPQIPKAYIRVRDENMTVFMVKKYLVRKLGLSNEAEIDISCMGQSLSHIQTLKQVRDAVWLPRLVESLNSTTLSLGDSHDMSINHIMSLLYRKHCFLN